MRVAVLGGGLFGATAAIYAARAGHDVHLFEAKSQIMLGASAGTFGRLHRGAHYPRHPETGRESRRAESSFRAEYGPAVIDGGVQKYVVPSDGSLVSVEAYRQFLDNEGLPFSEEGGVFAVEEPRINLGLLQKLVRLKVVEAGVAVQLGCRRTSRGFMRKFDRVIVATYARLNQVLADLGCEQQEYKFQVVEKPVVRLPERFRDTSIVVVDGPFGCLDPLDATPYHVLGHVRKSIHAENVGYRAAVPEHLANLLDMGSVSTRHTRVTEMAEDLAQYVPGVEEAQHLGSSFVIRAVLARAEANDKRPSIITRHDEQVYSVLSGKLGTACWIAKHIVSDLGANQAELAA
jgi:glycine/D-amino acid oxidase-like deaminating enzyme